jgi:hypothetical protein
MKKFSIELIVDNGRFARARTFTIEASNIRVAVAKAASHIRDVVPKRSRVAAVSLKARPMGIVSYTPDPIKPETKAHQNLSAAMDQILSLSGGMHG